MSLWVSQGTDNIPSISRGEFGAYAIGRILEMLRRHNVPATFFVPGHTALAFPDHVRAIVADGHEIGHHGWVHENPADFDRVGESSNFSRGLEALETVAGVRPTGYRSPSADFSLNTIEILREYDISYDSSCSATDFVPYYLRVGDRWSKTEPYVFGEPVDVVEVPFTWMLDDFPHFEFDVGWSTDQNPPSVVREIWQGEFDYALTNLSGGVFVLTMHPQVIGRGSRLAMLEALIGYMNDNAGVRFSTMNGFVAAWREANSLAAWVEGGRTATPAPDRDERAMST